MKNQDFLKTTLPLIELAQRDGYFSKVPFLFLRPSLDSLLAQPGNDPGQLNIPGGPVGYTLLNRINAGFERMKETNNNNVEIINTTGLPPEIQKLLLPLSFSGK
jgi:hypothetical protein